MSERTAPVSERTASLTRKTKETDIRIELDLDGSGTYEVSTGIPFFDHMLESFAKHALFDLRLEAKGDIEVDLHHTVEDVGITLGIRRFGSCVLPMAESKVETAVDVSNRPYLVYRVELPNDRVGNFDTSLVEDFLYAFSQNAGLDLHVEQRYGKSPHHVVEAVFKGMARALRTAVELDPRVEGVPSVKGSL